MKQNLDNEYDPFENNLECSTPFQYPIDNDESPNKQSIEFVSRLLAYILPSSNPRMVLSALCYAVGMDVGLCFGVSNTETDISKVLGVTKSAFCKEIKTICNHFGIQYINTGKNYEANETNRQNNFRPKANK